MNVMKPFLRPLAKLYKSIYIVIFLGFKELKINKIYSILVCPLK